MVSIKLIQQELEHADQKFKGKNQRYQSFLFSNSNTNMNFHNSKEFMNFNFSINSVEA